MRLSPFSLLVATLVVGTLGGRDAFARQWKVTLTKIVVDPTKASGEPWDGDGSAPDVTGRFGIGRVDGRQCGATPSHEVRKRQDTFEVELSAPIVIEAESPGDLCFAAKIVDKDLIEDDLIGAVAARLQKPTEEIRAGQATLTIIVAPVGRTTAPTLDLPTPPSHPNGLYRISIVSASIATTKADGTTWDPADDPEAENAATLMSLVKLGLSFTPAGAGAQVLSAAMSQPSGSKGPSLKALTRAAPDARVSLQWGDLTFDSPAHRNTYTPAWRTQFLVPKDVFDSTPMRADVVDDDDGEDEHIATQLFEPDELTKSSIARLKLGAVDELVLQVEKVAEASAPLERNVSITGAKKWVDTGLIVFGGQTIQVVGNGETCISGTLCVDSDGDTSSPITIGGLSVNAGQLAAIVGDDIYPIGSANSFVVRSGGKLGLGIARGDISSGALEATATVFYPVSLAPRGAALPSSVQP